MPSLNRLPVAIGEAAAATGLHPNTIRRLERRGLIQPRRTWAGHRRFAQADIARLRELAGIAEERSS